MPSSPARSPPLRAFAHLPAYDFDFDYRGHTIRPAMLRNAHPSSAAAAGSGAAMSAGGGGGYGGAAAGTAVLQPVYEAPLMDDFDSYMFPDSPSAYDATDPSLRSDATSATHTSITADGTASTVTPPPPPTGGGGIATRSASAVAADHHDGGGGDDENNGSNAVSGIALLPPAIDWGLVESAQLYAPDGACVEPSTLYTGYSTVSVLIFVPRQSVELCALVYAKLAHLFQQVKARLVFITPWTPAQATTFLSRFERVAPFPGAIICDSATTLFSAFHLTRSPLRALFAGGGVSAPMRQGVRNAFSTVSYRAANRDIATTAVPSKRLKVGALVVRCLRGYAKRPHVAYAGEELATTGVGCYMDVLSACGVNEAFVPDVDVAQLYARFNSMRVTSMKARVADEKEANRLRGNNNKARASRRGGDRRNALKT